jgi:hypothetical protein
VLAGLPGCGKTTPLLELQRNGWLVFDDFKARAIDDSPEFHKSRHFAGLVAGLRDGFRCVVGTVKHFRLDAVQRRQVGIEHL